MSTARKKAACPDQPTGTWIRPETRTAIYVRDSYRCVYCRANLRNVRRDNRTLDHIIARSEGGSNDPGNLVTACRSCNCSRQNKPLAQFAALAIIEHIGRQASATPAPTPGQIAARKAWQTIRARRAAASLQASSNAS